jgi:hypothetical protein
LLSFDWFGYGFKGTKKNNRDLWVLGRINQRIKCHARATDYGRVPRVACAVFLFQKANGTIFNFFLPLLDNILKFQKIRQFESESKANAMPFNTDELNRRKSG